MTKTNILWYFLLIQLFWGCQSKSESSSPDQLSLQGKELKVKEFINPASLEVYNSWLLVTKHYTDKKALCIIDLADLSVLSNAIKKGRGPGEMANPANMVVDEGHGILWFSDFGKNEMIRFPLDSLAANPNYIPIKSFPLNPAWIPTMNMFYYPSGYIGFTSVMIQKNLISFMNLQGQLVDSMAVPNKIYPDLWKDGGISDNPLICKYIPDYDRIILASRYENILSVIDMEGNAIFHKEDFPTKISSEQSLGSYRTFYSTEADEVFIFLLYSGIAMQEYDSDLGSSVIHYPNRLLVIDWKGQERYDISLDHPLITMRLDRLGRRLIGLTEDFDNNLVSYDLSGLYKD